MFKLFVYAVSTNYLVMENKGRPDYKIYLKSPTAGSTDIPRQTRFSRKSKCLNGQKPRKLHMVSHDECFDPDHEECNSEDYEFNEENESQQSYNQDVQMPFEDLEDSLHLTSESDDTSDDEFILTQHDEDKDKIPIFHGGKITKSESSLLIYSFVLRHKINKSAIDDLLQLINFHTPVGTNILSSRYKLMKNLNFDYSNAETHLYCPTCESPLDQALSCSSCTVDYRKAQIIDKGSFFITFKPKELISEILGNMNVASNLRKNLKSRSTENSVITNIFTGKLYKNLNLNPSDFTCLLNTDGVPVFKSSKYSMWPILYSINELDYDIGRRYILPLGLWSGSKKPNFDTFLEPIVKLVQDLSTGGIKWTCESEVINSRVFFPITVADSVARPIIQGILQFNGAYGCTWCLCKGKSWKSPENPNSHKWIYPPIKKTSLNLRNRQQFVNHLKEYNSLLSNDPKLKSHFGIRAASKLLLFPKFDIVNGFVFDYMHTALLGITRTFTNAWLDSRNHTQDFYIGRKLQNIDDNLLRTLVPFTVNRTVRSIRERCFWKASEWRTWSYISSVVLNEILPQTYLKHFAKFVKAMMILCSDYITVSSVNYAEDLLYSFSSETNSLYGESYCTYNVHLLLHAAECVRNWGPLSKFSAFTFENYNGVLLGYFQGSVKVPAQIRSHILEVHQAPQRKTCFNSTQASEYFQGMLDNNKRTCKSVTVENIVLLGSSRIYNFSDFEKSCLRGLGVIGKEQGLSFKSIILHSKVFNIFAKTTAKRSNCIVMVETAKQYMIHNIVLIDDLVCLSVSALICKRVDHNIFLVEKICHNRKLILAERIDPVKFFVISSAEGGISYIVKLPNIFEME